MSQEDESFVGVPQPIADAIFSIEKMAVGHSSTVQTKKDWELVEALFKYWAFVDPEGRKAAIAGYNARHQNGLDNESAIVKEGEARMQAMGDFPGKFYFLITKFFPDQKFEEKRFQHKLLNKFPLFKVSNRRL